MGYGLSNGRDMYINILHCSIATEIWSLSLPFWNLLGHVELSVRFIVLLVRYSGEVWKRKSLEFNHPFSDVEHMEGEKS